MVGGLGAGTGVLVGGGGAGVFVGGNGVGGTLVLVAATVAAIWLFGTLVPVELASFFELPEPHAAAIAMAVAIGNTNSSALFRSLL